LLLRQLSAVPNDSPRHRWVLLPKSSLPGCSSAPSLRRLQAPQQSEDRHQHRAAAGAPWGIGTAADGAAPEDARIGQDRCDFEQWVGLPCSQYEWTDFYGRRPLAFRHRGAAPLGRVCRRRSEQPPRRVCGSAAYGTVDVRSSRHRSMDTKPSSKVKSAGLRLTAGVGAVLAFWLRKQQPFAGDRSGIATERRV
jgi:hypothetical protein